MSFSESFKLALERVSAGDITPLMLFPLGHFTSQKYPDLPLTRKLADEVIANYSGGVLGTDPFVEISGNHDTSAPAGAWVRRVYMAPTKDGGEALFADVQWTEVGAQKVSDREYAYNSVELGSVVDNRTGAKTNNVLRSITLTNTPVIRLLPPVLEAGDSIAMAEPVEILCSEVTTAEDGEEDDPFACLMNDIEALIAKADETLRGKPGVRAIRTYLREVRSKAGAHKLAESCDESTTGDTDDGTDDGASIGDASGESLSASEDEPETTCQPDARKGGGDVKSIALKLNLAEDASEELVLSEVVRLSEERDAEKARADAAEAKLAEEAGRVRAQELEAALAEAMRMDEKGYVHLLPAQKELVLSLAESSHEAAMNWVAEAMKVTGWKFSEIGDGSPAPDPVVYESASVELAERAQVRKDADGVSFAEAQRLILTEDPALAERIQNERYGKEA